MTCGPGSHRTHASTAVHKFVGSSDTAGKSYDKDGRSQRGSKTDLAKPGARIEYQPLPEAALLSRFQSFLQSHARRGHQVRGRFLDRQLRQQGIELACRLQLSRAIAAACQMLLQLIAGIVRKL